MPASANWKPSQSLCQGCGVSFLTGGRGRPRPGARFCSRICSGSGPVTPRLIAQLTDTQAAYTAGLLDGEGSIIVWQRKDNPNGHPSLRVVIVNTDYPLMEWFEKTVGGKVSLHPNKPTNYSSTPKQCYNWIVNGRNAVLLLKQLIPYMVIKKAKAEYAISTQPSV